MRWADGVARSWAATYTRSLPPDVAGRRREEIRSDLFEHAASHGATHGQQFHVLGRVLWGIPADLSWRRAVRVSHERRPALGGTMKLQKTTFGAVAFAALVEVWLALGVWVGAGGGNDADAGGARYGVPLLLGAAVLAYGLSCRQAAPRRSTVLIVAGAAVPIVVLHWMAVIFVPLWLLVSGLAVASEPRRPQMAPSA